jgi:succinoglycan biosynthesis transport protein ExoP
LQRATIEGYELIIVDAPPMLGLAEPIEIACITDGVLVIGDAHKTNQRAVVNMVMTFERVHAKMLGLVLNRFKPKMSTSYNHYQEYSSYTRRLPAEVL